MTLCEIPRYKGFKDGVFRISPINSRDLGSKVKLLLGS